MRNLKVLFGLGFLVSLMLTSCAAPAMEVAVLKVTSDSSVHELSVSDIQKAEVMSVDYTNKKGETAIYTGYLLNDLLSDVTETSTIIFAAGDGYKAEMSGADLLACNNCIITFEDDGTLRLVMPDLSSKLQVKNLVEITIQ